MAEPSWQIPRDVALFAFAASALLFACNSDPDASQPDRDLKSSRQSVVGEPVEAPEMSAPPRAGHLPPVQVTPLPSSPIVTFDLCPLDKPSRSDWAQLQTSKAQRKGLQGTSTPPFVPPVPGPDVIAAQNQFLQAASQAGFENLSQEDREIAYADLKKNMLGELQ
jgi:hypothetical protein